MADTPLVRVLHPSAPRQRRSGATLPAGPPAQLAHLARRQLLQRGGLALATAALAAGALGGCGFALRQTPALPFLRLQANGFGPRSLLAEELRQRLAEAGVRLVLPTEAPEAVMQVLEDQRERSLIASTAVGQVRELQLRVRFSFRLSTPGGRALVPTTELLLSRDMSYSESFALAKQQEEAELYAAMQSDIVQQLLRLLARADLR